MTVEVLALLRLDADVPGGLGVLLQPLGLGVVGEDLEGVVGLVVALARQGRLARRHEAVVILLLLGLGGAGVLGGLGVAQQGGGRRVVRLQLEGVAGGLEGGVVLLEPQRVLGDLDGGGVVGLALAVGLRGAGVGQAAGGVGVAGPDLEGRGEVGGGLVVLLLVQGGPAQGDLGLAARLRRLLQLARRRRVAGQDAQGLLVGVDRADVVLLRRGVGAGAHGQVVVGLALRVDRRRLAGLGQLVGDADDLGVVRRQFAGVGQQLVGLVELLRGDGLAGVGDEGVDLVRRRGRGLGGLGLAQQVAGHGVVRVDLQGLVEGGDAFVEALGEQGVLAALEGGVVLLPALAGGVLVGLDGVAAALGVPEQGGGRGVLRVQLDGFREGGRRGAWHRPGGAPRRPSRGSSARSRCGPPRPWPVPS